METEDVFVSCDITFDEKIFPYASSVTTFETTTCWILLLCNMITHPLLTQGGSVDIEPNIDEDSSKDIASPGPTQEENMNTSSGSIVTETSTTVGDALGGGTSRT